MTPIFDGQPPQNNGFSNQNKGHLGSRYIYIYTYIHYIHISDRTCIRSISNKSKMVDVSSLLLLGMGTTQEIPQ